MRVETRDNLQIALAIFATIVLIVMNIFMFNPITLTVLRMVLAASWIGIGVLSITTKKRQFLKKTEL